VATSLEKNGGTGLFGVSAVFAVPRRLLGLKMWSMARLPGKAKELSVSSRSQEGFEERVELLVVR